MRISNFITPTIVIALLVAPGCKEETPVPNEPGEFGDPCVVGEPDGAPDGCVAGHYCYLGVCMEDCTSPSDCQPVAGWERNCAGGICHILCNADKTCPEDLNADLICDNAALYCEAEEYN